MRCPNLWRSIFQTHEPLTAAQAYGSSRSSRFGLYNDGLLASETDAGTYGALSRSPSVKYSDKLIRRQELAFQEKLCCFVPNGGETIAYSPYHEFKTACRTFAAIHISYLNGAYDPVVLHKWKETKTGLKNPLWREKSVYDFMASHLGYRFSVERAKVTKKFGRPGKIRVKLVLLNNGFASAYRKFAVALLVRKPDPELLSVFPVQTDTRHWLPGSPVTLTWNLDLAGWAKGRYELGLRILDPLSGKTVRLANTYPLNDKGMHLLGHLRLEAGERRQQRG